MSLLSKVIRFTKKKKNVTVLITRKFEKLYMLLFAGGESAFDVQPLGETGFDVQPPDSTSAASLSDTTVTLTLSGR